MVASLGDFFVNIKTNVSDNNLKKYTKNLAGVGKTALKVGGIMTTAFVGAGYGFSKLLNNVVMETAELGRLSEDLGVSPQFLENFTRSFEAVGSSAGDAISTIRTLKTQVEAFRLGRGDYESFGILGINPQQLSEDTTQSLDTIRNKFKDLSRSQQLYFVSQIGLSEKSLRILRLTDKEYEGLSKRSNQSPLVTNSQIQSSERYARNIRRLSQSFTSFKRALVSTATPAFTTFTQNLTKLFQNPAFQQDVGDIFDNLFSKTLPAIIKGAPIFIGQIRKITEAISNMADVVNGISDSKIFKLFSAIAQISHDSLKYVGEKSAGALIAGSQYLGEKGADLINNQIEFGMTPRGTSPINPRTGEISSQLGVMTDRELQNSGLGGSIESRRNIQSKRVMTTNNSITINVSKTNATGEDISNAVKVGLENMQKKQSENLKSGVYQ